jgi:hypothetical protein
LRESSAIDSLWDSFGTHLSEDRYHIWTVQELLAHNEVKTTMIYTHVLNRGARASRAEWTICRGEPLASYTETIYHPAASVVGDLIACNAKSYADSGDGVLCRSFAAHRFYEETI